ncbi:MAG: right-handed parallel beta-helix repeat-containing protein [Candidatus Brocadiia bacterium]
MSKATKILIVVLVLAGVGIAAAIYFRGQWPFSREPDVNEAMLELSRLRRLAEESPGEAIEPLQAYIEEHEGSDWASEARLVLAAAYERTGEERAAVDLLAEIAEGAEEEPRRVCRAILQMAPLLAPCGPDSAVEEPGEQDERVRQLLRQCLDFDHRDMIAEAHLRLGYLDLAHGDHRSAVEHFNFILSAGAPGQDAASEGLRRAALGEARRLSDQGAWAELAAWAEEMTRAGFEPTSPVGQVFLAYRATALRELGRFSEAWAIVERLAAIDPSLRSGDVEPDAARQALIEAEAAAGVVRTPESFRKALDAGTEKRAHFQGPIAEDTTWGAARSPLVLTGTATVREGATLTIQRGVVVQFLLGARLRVEGRLVARGVRFTSGVEAGEHRSYFDGEGIEFAASSPATECVFEDCTVEHQRTGLVVGAAGLAVRGSTFARNGQVAIAASKGAEVSIEGCTLSENAGAGVQASEAVVVVRQCRIEGNGGHGIAIEGRGAEATIERNRIEGNGTVGGGEGISCQDFASATIRRNAIARNQGQGVFLNGHVEPTIEANHITANQGAGIRCERDAAPTIQRNRIAENGPGIYLHTSSGAIENNLITQNNQVESQQNGIHCAANASPRIAGNHITRNGYNGVVCAEGSEPLITGNFIAGHDPNAISNQGSMVVRAPENYYGTTDENAIQKAIFNQSGGKVIWKPILAQPPPEPQVPELPDLP